MTPTPETERTGSEEGAEWPYASLLIFGFFGVHTRAGRRLVRESTVGLAVSLGSILALDADWVVVPEALLAAGIPAGVAVIVWAYGRYLGVLDELSRAIQLKAFAASYGAVMIIAAGVLGWALTRPDVPGATSAGTLLPWLILAELVRGVALGVLARRYR